MLVDSGVYLNISDFVRDAVKDKLVVIKIIRMLRCRLRS